MTNTENKFEYNGLIYIAVEESSCRLCAFHDKNGCTVSMGDVPSCSLDRQDGLSVCFILSDIDNKGEKNEPIRHRRFQRHQNAANGKADQATRPTQAELAGNAESGQ